MKANVEFLWWGMVRCAKSFSCQTQLLLKLSWGFNNKKKVYRQKKTICKKNPVGKKNFAHNSSVKAMLKNKTLTNENVEIQKDRNLW